MTRDRYAVGRGNSIEERECNLANVFDQLDAAAGDVGWLFRKHDQKPLTVLPAEDASTLRDIYNRIDQLWRCLPDVKVWCVVKVHVSPHDYNSEDDFDDERGKLGCACEFHEPPTECECEGLCECHWRLFAPSAWTGHLSKAQALRFRDAIDAHYRNKYPGPRPDIWKVAQFPCRIIDIVHRRQTAEDYVMGLGT